MGHSCLESDNKEKIKLLRASAKRKHDEARSLKEKSLRLEKEALEEEEEADMLEASETLEMDE